MFQDIEFGEISAEVELEINPQLITKGFYKYCDIIDNILNKHHFLILGNKGTGKSIIGEHLRLSEGLQDDKSYLFCQSVNLAQFPYKSFNKIISGQSDPETKFPTTWKWILLIYILRSFNKDSGISCDNSIGFNNAVETFKKIGLIPAELHEIALLASKNNFRIKLPIFEASFDSSNTIGGELHYLHMVSYLENTICQISSPNKHLLIIDGLDDILSSREIQYQSLTALISEAQQVNRIMRDNNVPFKVIVLCRKDLYRRLPGPNKNKITRSFSIDLDWYQDQVDIKDKEIYKLTLYRSSISGEQGDIFGKYFPAKIKEKHPAQYLLEYTRYTPRDFLQLLTYIKKTTKEDSVRSSDIISGIKEYSQKYFWPEIEDELDGYISKNDVRSFKLVLIELNKRQFMLNELIELALKHGLSNIDFHKIMETLYECGAISNMFKSNGHSKFQSRLKDDNDFNPGFPIVLHRGMHKALNMG